MRWRWMVMMVALACGCSASRSRPAVEPEGIASWYGPGFHGNPTSSGEVYDQNDLTAAHRTLPLGTRVAVTRIDTGRTVEVRINDRGPFVDERVIDLSYAAAKQLDMIGPGTAPVRLVALGNGGSELPATRYAVQVGAFADRDNAQRLRSQLARRFDASEVYVSTQESSGGSYFRVRLGTFEGREQAMERARDLTQLGLPAVVVEDVDR